MSKPSLHKPPPQEQRGSWFSILLAIFFLVLAVVVLFGLPLGVFVPVMLVGGLIFLAVIGFHYFVWGRWLTNVLQQEGDEDEDAEP